MGARIVIVLAAAFLVTLPVPVYALRADINDDGRVDMADLAILAKEWMMSNHYLHSIGNNYQGNIVVNDNAAINLGDQPATISVWIMLTDNTGEGEVVSKNVNYNGYALIVYYDEINGSHVGVWFEQQDDPYIGWACLTVPTKNYLQIGQWTLVTAVRDTENLKVYFNGQLQSNDQVDYTGAPNVDSPCDLRVMASGEQSIDDLRIYKKALTPQEILAIYNNGRGTNYTGAAAEGGEAAAAWEMDEGEGLTITDAVGGLTGTLEEYAQWQDGGVPFDLFGTPNSLAAPAGNSLAAQINSLGSPEGNSLGSPEGNSL